MGFLGFIPIVLVIVLVFFTLFFCAAMLTCIGISGLSVSLFLKNKTIKNLLLIGFGIILFMGLMCLSPFIVLMAELPTIVAPIAMCFSGACAGALTILGIKRAKDVTNNVARIILTILFYAVLVISLAAILLIILAAILFYPGTAG